MKLRKKRFAGVLVLLTVVICLIYRIYTETKGGKITDLDRKIFEMYDVYDLEDINEIFDVESQSMYFSSVKLDDAVFNQTDSLDSITFQEDGYLYLVNDTHIYVVPISSQDTIKPEIVVTNGETLVDSLNISYNSSVSNYIKIEAYDTQNGIKTDIPYEVSHNLEDKKTEDFQLVINTSDGVHSVTKTINVTVEPEKVVIPETPSGNTSSNLITVGLDRIDILVNKSNILPASFVPKLSYFPVNYSVSDGYRAHPEAVDAYIKMVDTMNSEIGEWMYVTSSYRDYEFQGRLYNNAIQSMGYDKASMLSAKPGASEHQTGLAIDVVTSGVSMYDFGTTKQSAWVNENAHRFGFIVRYQKGYESITGYNPEPWHLRYLGIDLATKVFNLNTPYENVYKQ